MAESDIEVSEGTGNVYADLGYPDAAEMQRKAQLATAIGRQIKALQLTQREAERRTGIPQPKLSGLLNGKFRGISETKMMQALVALNMVVEINIHEPANNEVGHFELNVEGSGLS